MSPHGVRRATADDAPAIAAVHVDSWEGAYRGLVPDAWFQARTLPVRIGHWRQWLADPQGPRVLVAYDDDDAVVGLCALATPSRDADADATTAEISALYVLPSSWRRGVGRALVAATVAELDPRAGWSALTLWVLEANERGRRFYERVGFVADGARFAEPDGPPEIRLRRALTDA